MLQLLGDGGSNPPAVLKCAKDDDEVTLQAKDNADVLSLRFEAKKIQNEINGYLGISNTEYDCKVTMLSAEFARTCRELAQLDESVRIEANKKGIRFASEGEIANSPVEAHGCCP
ncbi:hypothetical protein BS47DRAFT_1366543 [Hydnum rufescens UP504]|uniref:Uncharacterized protein n=1 Tax=Hydnum rufescens UP504 TaxID=1448309 RepID=A0A9P6AMR3_9AGAM|nr:hypothetical protein BS47DRAFT_1366543 [Hydnum rufescens UP504]